MKLIEILQSDLSPEASFTLLQLIHRRVQSLDEATRTLVGLGELVDRGLVRLTIDLSTEGVHRKGNRVNILKGTGSSSPDIETAPERPSEEPREASPMPTPVSTRGEPSEAPSRPSSEVKPRRADVVARMESALKRFEKKGRSKPKPSKVVPEILKDPDIDKGIRWVWDAMNRVRVSIGISEVPDHLSPLSNVQHLLGIALFCLRGSVDPEAFIEVLYRETRWQNNAFPSLSTLAGDWAQGTFWSNRPDDSRGRLKPTADARVSMDERQSATLPRRVLRGLVEEGQESFHFQRAEALLDSPAELLDELERTHNTDPESAMKLVEIVKIVASHTETPSWFDETIQSFTERHGGGPLV